jgi:hypothetical protein
LRTQCSSGSGQQIYLSKTLSPVDATTCIAGVALSVPPALVGTAGYQVLSVRQNATCMVYVRLNQDYTLSVLRGAHGSGVVLGTTTAVLAAGTFVYVELKVVLHDTAGTVDLRLNNVSVLSLTSQDTVPTSATAAWNIVALGMQENITSSITSSGGALTHFDDVYVCDGSGAAPWNSFLGDVRVDPRYPTGAGATTGWTPSAGANWAALDETAPNDDSDYASAAAAALTDTFVVQDAPVVGATILGVQHCLALRKTDAGICTVSPVVRHSSVDYAGAALSPGTTYSYGLQVAQVNPGTSAAWTEAGFNAAEFGYTRVT